MSERRRDCISYFDRTLAKAVQEQDVDAVLAHHAPDMLMFDVPPPNEVKGRRLPRDLGTFFRNFSDSGGHWIQQESPAAVNKELIEFLQCEINSASDCIASS